MNDLKLIGDGKYDNSQCFRELLSKGGDIVIEEGVYLTGPLDISSDTRIHLKKNAVIRFIDDLSLYGPVYSRWEE